MKNLPKQYDPKEAEPRWQATWEQNRTYAWDPNEPRENTFVIDTPPPTVSGHLHMGHIFSYTQADFVARYQRMSGKTVFYPMGFDDNGLPTERLVESIKGKKASQYPTREDFIKDCKEVVNDAEEKYRALFKSTALSVDWNEEYQTVSATSRAISQASFLDLLAKGEAYRQYRPTYWDWVDQTAIAQAEIEEKEQPGIQITIPFGIVSRADWKAGKRPAFDSLEKVPVMTTRPELLGACVALMCHPSDEERFKDCLAISPLFNIAVRICSDEKVDKEKGTGFVMCCSWGDDTDKEWISKNGLAWRPLVGKNGRINANLLNSDSIIFDHGDRGKNGDFSQITSDNCIDVSRAHTQFKALIGKKLIRDVKNENSAKGIAIELLEQAGLLLPQGEKGDFIIHKVQTVKCAERSGTPIEIIPTYQWFVRITDKKEALKSKGAQCEWHPEFMRIRLDQWIDGLKEDWCVSRQRFFGVPFPVWYSRRPGEEGKVLFASPDQLPVDPLVDLPKGYSREEVDGDKDVMDTWATSSVSPQLSAHGISANNCKDKARFEKLFPADLRPQAHEIIRTWAFYTIVKAHLHTDTIPWKHVMISGWCLAADKTKMSKSKGNVVTPVELIRDKGADVVRYWASTSRLGADTAFSEDLLKIGKKLVTKLWNATSFAAIHLSKLNAQPTTAVGDLAGERITEMLDKWILTRLHKTIAKATEDFERLEYCDARVAIEDFFWKDFCDNYLELVKVRAYGEAGDATAQASAHYTLHHCLHAILRLFAPFLPHVTEELYHHLFDASQSVHARGHWPTASDYPCDDAAEDIGMACVAVLEAVRKAKSERNVSIKFPITELVVSAGSAGGARWGLLEPVAVDLKGAGTIGNIRWAEGAPVGAETADKRFAIAPTFGEQTDAA